MDTHILVWPANAGHGDCDGPCCCPIPFADEEKEIAMATTGGLYLDRDAWQAAVNHLRTWVVESVLPAVGSDTAAEFTTWATDTFISTADSTDDIMDYPRMYTMWREQGGNDRPDPEPEPLTAVAEATLAVFRDRPAGPMRRGWVPSSIGREIGRTTVEVRAAFKELEQREAIFQLAPLRRHALAGTPKEAFQW